MVVSALGGMGAATVCHPIDVLRIQMQLQKFNSTLGCAKHIVGGCAMITDNTIIEEIALSYSNSPYIAI
jgi:hypothetical protein